jgi:metal-responsive CopG/Arc/MetJ family transcriptional regulator
MRNVVAVSLPGEVLKKLSCEAKTEHVSRSEVVRKALKQYFFVSSFSRLRLQAQKELARKGVVVSEEELFGKIS